MGNQPQPPPVQDALRKVDQAMARLQEIQCTISGGSILCGGVALSPRSTRGYLRTSLRCKEESLRMKELAIIVDEESKADKGQQIVRSSSLRRLSSNGQQIVRSSSLRRLSSNGEWRRWSTPALLIEQTVGEIMEASNLTKEVAQLVSNSIEDKPAESPKSAQSSLNEKSMVDELNESKRQRNGFGENAGLQTFGSKPPDNPVHRFKVTYKDTSTVKCQGKIEKEEHATRIRTESPNPNARFQRQLSFKASDQVKKQGRAKNFPSSLPVSLCSSPVTLIKEKTTSARPFVKVEQTKPECNSWMFRSGSSKVIMFPNSAFVPSPLKNNQEVKCTNASMKRNSLASVKDLKSLRMTNYPCNTEKHSGVCMVADSPTVRKSSSFSRMSRSSSTKAIVFPKSPFVPFPLKNNQEVKSSNASRKRNSLPSVKELESLRITDYPCTKEEHYGVRMVTDSPTVRKSSSFSWIPDSSPTKAIMSSNPALLSSPLKNNPQDKSTKTSMKRNSLPSIKELKSLSITDYACNKEEHSDAHMVADSPTVRKSSSFSWMSRSSSSKAVMFPNPAFVSSPLMNDQEIKSTNASMKRNSLPSVKDKKSLRTTYYPCNVEENSGIFMVAESPTVRKSSLFSAAYQPSASKSIKQSPMPSLLHRTLKKFHVIKASTPGSPQIPSELDAKAKFGAFPALEKSESLRLVSSSQKQDYLVRRHSMSSCDPSAESRVSRLSKQHIKSLVQLPKKISSVIMHSQSVPQVGDIASKSGMMSEAEKGHRTRKLSEILASSAEDVRKQGTKGTKDNSMQSSVPIMENISVNEMQRGRHVQKFFSPLNSTKERHLRPISINSALNSSSRHENDTGSLEEMIYTTESKDKLIKQKIKMERKENRDNVQDGMEKDKGMKKSTGFLRNSWSFTPDNTRSFHKEKLHTVTGGLPFLKNVKAWMTLQRSASQQH